MPLFAETGKPSGVKIDPKGLEPDETPAKYTKGREGVGGKLYLTNQRLIFKSHQFNIQKHVFSISLHKIRSAGRYKATSIINDGLIIETDRSKPEKFVVEQAEEWVRQLQEKIMVDRI